MTESEAINKIRGCFGVNNLIIPYSDEMDAFGMAIEALDEIHKYRELGTVEELRKAAEKRKKKTPYMYGDGYADGSMVYDMYECPGCGESYEIDGEKYDFCPKCGQAIDWNEIL